MQNTKLRLHLLQINPAILEMKNTLEKIISWFRALLTQLEYENLHQVLICSLPGFGEKTDGSEGFLIVSNTWFHSPL